MGNLAIHQKNRSMKLEFETQLKDHQVDLSGYKINEETQEIDESSVQVKWSMNMIIDEQGVIGYDFLIESAILSVVVSTYADDDELPIAQTTMRDVLPMPTVLDQEVTIRKTDTCQEINCTGFGYQFSKDGPNRVSIEISM